MASAQHQGQLLQDKCAPRDLNFDYSTQRYNIAENVQFNVGEFCKTSDVARMFTNKPHHQNNPAGSCP